MDQVVYLLLSRIMFMCGIFQLFPFGYSLYQGTDVITGAFAASILVALLSGVVCLGLNHRTHENLTVLEAASFLFICWWVLAVFGCLPYYFSADRDFAGALFESVSCFTTTGISNLLVQMDAALILWRSMSQWLGGYIVLLLLCTVLPRTSGCFGTSFILPGNMRTGAITLKRINRAAKKLFRIYTLVSLLGLALYYSCGLSFFDAINMTFVTISTGGCYTPDATISINRWLAITAFFGVLTSGCNILLYWQAVNRKQTRVLKQTLDNSETRIFFLLLFVFTAIIATHLYLKDFYDLEHSIANSLFQVVSFACTTGIMAEQMLHWDDFEKFMLLCLALIGGCIGSLAGGFKIFRLQVLFKSAIGEMKRTLHPNMVVHILVDGRVVPPKIIERILAYFFMYFVTVLLSLLVISLSGLDMQQTMDVAVACLTSTGQMMLFHSSFAEIHHLPDWIKLYCCLIMIIGKINIFTFLLVISGGWSKLQTRHWN